MPRVLSYQLENIASMGVKMMYRTTLCSYTCVGIFWGGLEGGVECWVWKYLSKNQCRSPLSPIETVCIHEHVQWVLFVICYVYRYIRTCVTMHEHSYKRADLQLDVDLCGWGTYIFKIVLHCPVFNLHPIYRNFARRFIHIKPISTPRVTNSCLSLW